MKKTPKEVCLSKIKYYSFDEAQTALNTFCPKVADFQMMVYRCPCSKRGFPHFHIGHPRGTERPIQPKRKKKPILIWDHSQDRHCWDREKI